MSKQIKTEPLDDKTFNSIYKKKSKLIDLALETGLRLKELKSAIDNHEENKDHVWIHTKKSLEDNKIVFSDDALLSLKECKLLFKGSSIKTYQRVFDKVANEMQISFHPHVCRTTFATRAHARGVPIETISKLLNHSSISQTAKYIWTNGNNLKVAAEQAINLNTLDGYTLLEYKQLVQQQLNQIRRLENEIKELKNEK